MCGVRMPAHARERPCREQGKRHPHPSAVCLSGRLPTHARTHARNLSLFPYFPFSSLWARLCKSQSGSKEVCMAVLYTPPSPAHVAQFSSSLAPLFSRLSLLAFSPFCASRTFSFSLSQSRLAPKCRTAARSTKQPAERGREKAGGGKKEGEKRASGSTVPFPPPPHPPPRRSDFRGLDGVTAEV